MKCCASQITSTVRSVEAVPSRAREIASQFNALMMAAAFKPLASALGFYGDLVVGVATQATTRSERGGLTDALERSIALSQPGASVAASVP